MRITRRQMLAALGATTGWLLTGCQNPPPSIVADLPDPLSPLKADRLEDSVPYAPPSVAVGPASRPATIPAPPPATAPVPTPAQTITVVPRSAWARGGPILSRVEPMDGIQLITFHHSGDPVPFYDDTFSGTADHLENVREWHIHPIVNRARPQGAGMCDIGYHFAIDRVGRVWALRSPQYQGEHVAGHNPHNLGVVVLGNFDLQSPTDAQRAQIRAFGNQLRHQLRLPISRIFTHQELKSTLCPGRRMQPYMVAIRRNNLI